MAERFGARLKYEDELSAEMRQCEEQLEFMYIKREQRKQQRVRDEEQRRKEEEERRARKASKKEEERRVKRHETELKKIEEAIQRRETEYLEIKRLDTIKLQRMKEEMDRVGTELQKVMAKRDRARKIRQMKRKEETEREQDEMKEKMQRQPDVKDETLKDQNIGFHRTSDELRQYQTPILIQHTDKVLVNVHEISKFEYHYDVARTEGMLSPGVDAVQELVASQDRVLPEIMTVIDEVDLDDGQDEHPKPELSNVQAGLHFNEDHRDEHEESEGCSTKVFDARTNLEDKTLYKADAHQNRVVADEQATHPAIPCIPDSQESLDCIADAFQQRPVEVEQVAISVMSYLSDPHASHTVHIVLLSLLYCYASTLVGKIFHCVSLCLLYVIYCSILLRYCTYLNPCSV